MRALLALFALALAQTSCSDVPLSYYDQATYAQLTSLKAEATALVESFDTKPVEANEPRIEATSLSLRKAVEYEKGKGPTNSDTASQVEKINQLFHDDVKDYATNEPTMDATSKTTAKTAPPPSAPNSSARPPSCSARPSTSPSPPRTSRTPPAARNHEQIHRLH